MHDAVKAALIRKAIDNGEVEEIYDGYWSPEKYQRMWKKITGKDITLKEAEIALKQ